MQIKRIDIIHHSHADYGYTDHPAVVRELQNRYIDMALNFVADSHGVMEFTFDLVWRKEGIEGSEAARLAESVSNDLLVLVKSR